jgi:hypothetical protein
MSHRGRNILSKKCNPRVLTLDCKLQKLTAETKALTERMGSICNLSSHELIRATDTCLAIRGIACALFEQCSASIALADYYLYVSNKLFDSEFPDNKEKCMR